MSEKQSTHEFNFRDCSWADSEFFWKEAETFFGYHIVPIKTPDWQGYQALTFAPYARRDYSVIGAVNGYAWTVELPDLTEKAYFSMREAIAEAKTVVYEYIQYMGENGSEEDREAAYRYLSRLPGVNPIELRRVLNL